MPPNVRTSWLPDVHDTGAESVSCLVVDPSGFTVVVVVVVVVCVVELLVTVPAGFVAFGSTTRSVGWTCVAGTTWVATSVDDTGFEAVESAGVGVACAPTETVFDSTEFGSLAGRDAT